MLAALTLVAILTAGAPGAAAHPVDVFNFFAGPVAFPAFIPPFSPPSFMLPTFAISGVTADDTFTGSFIGAGDCDDVGQACLILPTWNPFIGGPVGAFDCEIVSAAGPWVALPTVFLAQDLNGNNIIETGADLIMTIGFPYGSPGGPIPPFLGPAGAYGGGFFLIAGGPFIPGMPIHFIAAHPGFPVTPASALLQLGVTCWVM